MSDTREVADFDVWEMLSQRIPIEPFAEHVHPDVYERLTEKAAELNVRFTEIERDAFAVLTDLDRSLSTEEQQQCIAGSTYPTVVAAMLDGRNHAPEVWAHLRPDS